MSSRIALAFRAIILTILLVAAQTVNTVQAVSPSPDNNLDPNSKDYYDEIFFAGNGVDWHDPRCTTKGTFGKTVQLAGNDNIEKILNFFMREAGLSLAQAAGFVGNMQQESGLNPAIIEGGKIAPPDYTPVPRVGFGLVQWTSPNRQNNLVNHMKGLGVQIIDLSGQLSFTWKEINDSYSHVVRALKSTQDPVVAAIIIHGRADSASNDPKYTEAMRLLENKRGYEISGDSGDMVVKNRGGFAQKVYDKYRDAPALAGSTADPSMKPAGEGTDDDILAATATSKSSQDSCSDAGANTSGLANTIKSYAWPKFRGNDPTPTEAYAEAVKRAMFGNPKRYVGGTSRPGIDCGGFISLAMQDSGYEKNYNYGGTGKAGNTTQQWQWMKDNWRELSGTEISADKQTGDVAINNEHTYMYVDNKDKQAIGFQTNIASASLNQRAPMAGDESPTDGSNYKWYRKK